MDAIPNTEVVENEVGGESCDRKRDCFPHDTISSYYTRCRPTTAFHAIGRLRMRSAWIPCQRFVRAFRTKARDRTSRESFHARLLSCDYQPLRTNEIRLLDLYPGQNAEPIRCGLRHATLSKLPRYDSLSYCWGLNRPDKEIESSNGTIPVTSNLFAALQHLRHPTHTQTLWIDAVCINQANIEERGAQVAMMKDIFQLSERTVVWLGEEAQNSHLAMSLIWKLARASQERGTLKWWSHESRQIPPLYDAAWKAFGALLRRQWWQRAWIVQEVSVAKDILVVCGNNIVSWQELVEAIQYAVDLGVFIGYGGSTTYQALKLFETRTDFQKKHLPPLHHILLRNRSFLATDARDKVFGLLSLADPTDVQAMDVKPDYHLSVEQLYKNIAMSLLKQSDTSAFSASGIHSKSPDRDLPSWVPDWSASDPSIPLSSIESLTHGDKSSFAGSRTPNFRASKSTLLDPEFNHEQGLFGSKGLLIDQVETVGVLARTRYLRHVSHMFELFVQCRDILEQLKDWEQIACGYSRDRYPTGERYRDAYWYTLCAGRVSRDVHSAHQDPRFKYYMMTRSLRSFVRFVIRWFPRSEADTIYNRMFYSMFQAVWRIFGLTPAKIQRIGFPPESRLSNHRRMVRTTKGYLALAPRYTQRGDWLAVCKGAKMPLVVRKETCEESWLLIGESYVHGVMDGEAWDEKKTEMMWFK